jgi:ABC-type thiamine transport system substrate-binding protein
VNNTENMEANVEMTDAPAKKNIEPIIEHEAQEDQEVQNEFLEFALSAEVQKALEKLKFTKLRRFKKLVSQYF